MKKPLEDSRDFLAADHRKRAQKEIDRFWKAFRREPGYEIFSAVHLGDSAEGGEIWSSSFPRNFDPTTFAGWGPVHLYNALTLEGISPSKVCTAVLTSTHKRSLEFWANWQAKQTGEPLYRLGKDEPITVSDRQKVTPLSKTQAADWVRVREYATSLLRKDWLLRGAPGGLGQVAEVQIRTGVNGEEIELYHRTLRGEGSLSDYINLGKGRRNRRVYDIETDMIYYHTVKGERREGFARKDKAKGLTLYVVTDARTGPVGEATPEHIAEAKAGAKAIRERLQAEKDDQVRRARRLEEERRLARASLDQAAKYKKRKRR